MYHDTSSRPLVTSWASSPDYRLFFLFTIGHGFKCTRVQYTPDLSKKDYAIGVCYAEPVYIVSLTNKRKKELDTMMDDLVKGRSYRHTGQVHHYTLE